MTILADKTVIVAGVGPGLGSEIARLAYRDGANVVIAARRQDKLVALANEIDPDGNRIACQVADIGDSAQCETLVKVAVERYGGLDAVTIVAANDAHMGGLSDTDDETWRAVLETNVIGTMHVIEAATPAMSSGGSVVMIGSQNMALASIRQTAYAASKGALRSAMYHLVEEFGPARIRVNMVVPTWMWGPPVQMYVDWQSSERSIPAEEVVAEITANMPLGEIPADEDVAEAVVWLFSDRARMITGQTLYVNAGEHQP
ncbi:MAG: SDR family oxidoreductase [Acidobacteria bacterium]|nr:SDR family oxidoreductase [Acidobacteriota bacterium]